MDKLREWIARGESALKWLPERTATNLIKMLGYYATVLYAVLLLCHAVFRGGFTARALAALATCAVMAAITACLGFWMNRRLFFILFSLGLTCGALYMLAILIFNMAPGWGDAASLLGFLLIAFLGLLFGVGMEYVKYLLKPSGMQGQDSN